MSPRPAIALPFSRPFTTQQAYDFGITAGSLRHRVLVGEICRLRNGVYAPAGELSPRDRIAAALLTAPEGAVLGFEASAILHGIPIPHSKGLQRVDLFVPTGTPSSGGRPDPEVRLHYVELPVEQITFVGGHLATTIARTAVDLSRGRSLARALIALDYARRAGVRLSELYDARYAVCGMRGVAILDQALRECSPLAESPFESRSRAAMLVAGLPRPVLQQEVTGESGAKYRADFYWRAARLIGEADGFGKYAEDPSAFRREKIREDDLRLAGYAFVRWTWSELMGAPDVLVARLRDCLLRRPTTRSADGS